MIRLTQTRLCSLVATLAFASITHAQILGDFGDAPDNLTTGFPSRLGSLNAASGFDAPYHLDSTSEWIGYTAASTTTSENDSRQVGGDIDDGFSSIWSMTAAGIGHRGYLTTTLSYDPSVSSKSETRYVNAAVDFNNNLQFGDMSFSQREWVVRNQPVDFSGLPDGITSVDAHFGFHLDPSLIGIENRWVRVTFSDQPVAPNGEWDGSGPLGGFARGETEDFLLPTLQTVTRDENGKDDRVLAQNGAGGAGGGAGARPAKLGPAPVAIVNNIVDLHANTPGAPDPARQVAMGTFNVPPQAVLANGGPFNGEALFQWTRICDIGTGECNHKPFESPNPVSATLGGPLFIGGFDLPPAGQTAQTMTTGLNAGINRIPVIAQFANQDNGDTHSTLRVWTDPDDEVVVTHQVSDAELYASVLRDPGDITDPEKLGGEEEAPFEIWMVKFDGGVAPPHSEFVRMFNGEQNLDLPRITSITSESYESVNFGIESEFDSFDENHPFPNGAGTSAEENMDNYAMAAWATVTIPEGFWSIAIGSDDGGQLTLLNEDIEFLEGIHVDIEGFETFIDDLGRNQVIFEENRAHGWTIAQFDTLEETQVTLFASMHEAQGFDSFEIAIRDNLSDGDDFIVSPETGWSLLEDGALDWQVASDVPVELPLFEFEGDTDGDGIVGNEEFFCPGDINRDGAVNFADFLILSNAFGQDDGGPADINEDGSVNFADFLFLSSNFGKTIGAASVPEPNSWVLLVFGFAWCLRQARRAGRSR